MINDILTLSASEISTRNLFARSILILIVPLKWFILIKASLYGLVYQASGALKLTLKFLPDIDKSLEISIFVISGVILLNWFFTNLFKNKMQNPK